MKRMLLALMVVLALGFLVACEEGELGQADGTATGVPVRTSGGETPAAMDTEGDEVDLEPDFAAEDLLGMDEAWDYDYTSFRQTTIITWTQPSGVNSVAAIRMDAVESQGALGLNLFGDDYVRNVSIMFRQDGQSAGPVTFVYGGGDAYAKVGAVWYELETVSDLADNVGWLVNPRGVIEDAPNVTRVEDTAAVYINDPDYGDDMESVEPLEEPIVTGEQEPLETPEATAMPTVQGQAQSTPAMTGTMEAEPTIDLSPETTAMPAGAYPPPRTTFSDEDLRAAYVETVNGIPAWHYRYEDVVISPLGFFGEFEENATVDVWVSVQDHDVIRMMIDATAVDPELDVDPRPVQIVTYITRVNEPTSFAVPADLEDNIAFDRFTTRDMDVSGLSAEDQEVVGQVVDEPDYDTDGLVNLLTPYGVPVIGEPTAIDVLEDVVIYRVENEIDEIVDMYVVEYEADEAFDLVPPEGDVDVKEVEPTRMLFTFANDQDQETDVVVLGSGVADETTIFVFLQNQPPLVDEPGVGMDMDIEGAPVIEAPETPEPGMTVEPQVTMTPTPAVGVSTEPRTGAAAQPETLEPVYAPEELLGVGTIWEYDYDSYHRTVVMSYTQPSGLDTTIVAQIDAVASEGPLGLSLFGDDYVRDVAMMFFQNGLRAGPVHFVTAGGTAWAMVDNDWEEVQIREALLSPMVCIGDPSGMIEDADVVTLVEADGTQLVQVHDDDYEAEFREEGLLDDDMNGVQDRDLDVGDDIDAEAEEEAGVWMGAFGDEDLVNANVEVVNGIPAWHYRLEGVSLMPIEGVGEIADDAVVDLWVSVEDEVVVRMVAIGTLTSQSGTERDVMIKCYLTQINQPVSFDVPSDVAGNVAFERFVDEVDVTPGDEEDVIETPDYDIDSLRDLLDPWGIPVLDSATDIEVLQNVVIYRVPESPDEVRDMLAAGFEEGSYVVEVDGMEPQVRYMRQGQEVDVVVIGSNISDQTTVIYTLDGFEPLVEPEPTPVTASR